MQVGSIVNTKCKREHPKCGSRKHKVLSVCLICEDNHAHLKCLECQFEFIFFVEPNNPR